MQLVLLIGTKCRSWIVSTGKRVIKSGFNVLDVDAIPIALTLKQLFYFCLGLSA